MKNVVFVLAAILLAACSSTPKKEATQTTSPQPATTVETAPEKPVADSTPAETVASPASQAASESEMLAAEIKRLEGLSVYFDFDKSNVKPSYKNIVEQQAAFLKTHRNDSVTLEGNADERGSNEYNLALGNRRANSTRKSLEILGVPSSQIRVISYGEEKPRLTCSEEKCWQENRRCDFNHSLN